jgi:hypothetical protein
VEPAEVALVLETDAATQLLTVTTVPAGLPGVTYTYVSEHRDIATVSDAGLVTAVAAGATTITVTAAAPNGTPVTKAVPVTVDYAIDPAFNKAAWTATETSKLGDGAEAIRMFDDDLTSIWHSATSGMPQGFTVDMQGYKRIDGFWFINRQDVVGTDRQYPKDLTVETSMNGADWTPVYTATEAVMKKLRVALPLQNQVIARYFKVTVTSTAFDAPYTYFAEFGAYNEAEPLSTPVTIALNTPAAALEHPAANPLTFSWEADDPKPANYTLKLSKNQDLGSATEYTVAGTSKEVSVAELATILGDDGIATIYWTVSAASATSPAARTFTLDGREYVLLEDKLVNTKRPFSFDMNPEYTDDPTVGQWWEREWTGKLTGWTHDTPVQMMISYEARYDHANGSIAMWAIAGGNLDYMNNAKVYQTVNLEAGDYKLIFHTGGMDGVCVDAYGVVVTGAGLPDHTAVTSDANVLGYDHLSDHLNSDVTISFTVPAGGSDVTIGWVYNTWDNGSGYASYKMHGLDLYNLR